VVPIKREEVVRQSDLAELEVMEGDFIEARETFEARRMQIIAALVRGATVEDGPLRVFLKRYERVGVDGRIVRSKLIVR
jgi:hypothetical protein